MMKRFTLLRLLLVFVDLIRLLGWLFRGLSPEMYSTTKALFSEWPPRRGILLFDRCFDKYAITWFSRVFAQQDLFWHGWEFDLLAMDQETIKITTRGNIFQNSIHTNP